MHQRTHKVYGLMLIACFLGSCTAFEPWPLEPDQIMREESAARLATSTRPNSGQALSLPELARLMTDHAPRLQRGIAEYRKALQVAEIAEPYPNPSFDLGPQFATGRDVNSKFWAPFGNLNITIPLSDRRAVTEDLYRARSTALRVAALATQRELFLELREAFVKVVSASAKQRSHAQLVTALEQRAKHVKKLVDAGQATALDLALFDLEQAKAQQTHQQLESSIASARTRLAALIGISSQALPQGCPTSIPLPDAVPTLDELSRMLSSHHPALARLRAQYEVAEHELKLEIEKQYPDLVLGPGIVSETGERKTTFTLGFGLELPLFDRNQRAITEMSAERERIRSEFRTAVNSLLGEVEQSYCDLLNTRREREAMESHLLPRARSTLQLARSSVVAGGSQIMRLLDVGRGSLQVGQDAANLKYEEWASWVELEKTIGLPLLELAPDTAPIPSALEPSLPSPEIERGLR